MLRVAAIPMSGLSLRIRISAEEFFAAGTNFSGEPTKRFYLSRLDHP
jgi:hypothetical protein